jgi:hypothetical protein
VVHAHHHFPDSDHQHDHRSVSDAQPPAR